MRMRDCKFVTRLAQTTRTCTRRLLAPCLFVLLSLNAVTVSAESQNPDPLTAIIHLAKQGAAELALQQLEQQQPAPLDKPDDWLRWERQRIELYRQSAAWQTLINRIEEQQPYIEEEYRAWFVTQQAEAMLALGEGSKARSILQRLVWLHDGDLDNKALSLWRRHIIRSYLLDNKTSDAHSAMLRHEHDYPKSKTENHTLLRARVLLVAERPLDAAELLKNEKGIDAQTVYLLSALRSARLPAKQVIKKTRSLLKKKKAPALLRARLFNVLAEASKVEDDRVGQITALEKMLSLTRVKQLDDGLFRFSGEQLWQAYHEYGQIIGNQKQLLLGDDQSWFSAADKLKKNVIQQRSLYGFLGKDSRDTANRARANEWLVNSLRNEKNGVEIVRHLYLKEATAQNTMPAIARYSLLEKALKESDITLASRLMAGLSQAPKGIDKLQWELRRARVFVMASKPDEAVQVLDNIITNSKLDNGKALDRLMQVLFDLQTIEAHDQVYRLFEKMLGKIELPQFRRELYYWMADSRKAQSRHADAAVLYLKSAESNIGKQPDLWAQSALYQAAESLANAALTEDARRIYEKLLRLTKDPSRRAQLQRRIQQLWLQQSKGGNKV